MSAKFDFSAIKSGFQRRWPVTINMPLDDGKIEVQTFSAVLRMLSPADIEAAVKDIEDSKIDPDRALAKKYLVGLPDGPELTEDYLREFLAPPFVVLGLKAAYQDFVGGVAAKN